MEVSRNYAFLTANSQLTVVDVSDPANPTWVASLVEDALLRGWGMGLDGDIVYVAAPGAAQSPTDGQVAAVDISNPASQTPRRSHCPNSLLPPGFQDRSKFRVACACKRCDS